MYEYALLVHGKVALIFIRRFRVSIIGNPRYLYLTRIFARILRHLIVPLVPASVYQLNKSSLTMGDPLRVGISELHLTEGLVASVHGLASSVRLAGSPPITLLLIPDQLLSHSQPSVFIPHHMISTEDAQCGGWEALYHQKMRLHRRKKSQR